MTVIVYNGAKQIRYDAISAIGVGHIRKDLVLVPEGASQPIDLAADQWVRFEVHRIDLPPSEPEPEHLLRRAIGLDGKFP